MCTKLLLNLFIGLFTVSVAVAQTDIKNELKTEDATRVYITAITSKTNLEEYSKLAKEQYDVELKFKKIRFSKLDKIRNIKILVEHDTFKQEAEFNNTFEILPIEITLKRQSDGKVQCKIVEMTR